MRMCAIDYQVEEVSEKREKRKGEREPCVLRRKKKMMEL
jgi:hypothetical protein